MGPTEPPSRDPLRNHRPLPSVGIPLLREERQAERNRRLGRGALAGALGLAVLGAVVGIARLGGSGSEPIEEVETEVEPSAASAAATPAEPPAPDAAVPAPTAPTARGPFDPVVERKFGKAHGFRDAVEKAGLNKDESAELTAALEPVMDFRRCKPDDLMTLERSGKGELVRFGYKSGLTQRFEVKRLSTGKLEGRQVEVPIRSVRIEKGGIIQGSLGDALQGLSLRRALAGVFVEVFEGKVNFTTQTRTGDTFRVIVDEEYVEDTFLGYGAVHALEYRGQRVGTLRAFWHTVRGQEGDFYDERGRAMHGGWLRTPVRYDSISSPFGMRMHPVLRRRKMHNGLDYAAASGTPVRAAANGTITFAGRKGANGNLLSLKHFGGYETHYAHLLRFAKGIAKGKAVKQREVIAYVGSTGRSTGPHLHFGLKRHGKFVDPRSQLNGPGKPMPNRALPAYKKIVRRLTAGLERISLETPRPVDAEQASGPTGFEED